MRSLTLAALMGLALSPVPGAARAGVAEAVDAHVLPGTAKFAAAAAGLAADAAADCTAEALRPGYTATFDAWMGISHLTFGPLEENGRRIAIAFWPDSKGMVASTLARFIANEDPVVHEGPEAFHEVSVAVRGLFALERLAYDPEYMDYGPGDYSCALAQAITTDLARMASEIDAEWRNVHGDLLKTAGAPDNTLYLGAQEAVQALGGALVEGLDFDQDQRLGRPLGTFDRPRPRRAEAWRSDRSKRNVALSLVALHDLSQHLAGGESPLSADAFARAIAEAEEIETPDFSQVEDPIGRLKLEALETRVGALADTVALEIGRSLGLTVTFNDGDGG